METPKRSELKDNLAYVLIYGGGALLKMGLIAAAVAAHLISPQVGRQISRNISKPMKFQEDQLWEEYKKTGSISAIINKLI